ncbi:unnamed protein product [Cyprideis torosa]|uniref:Uncharacterized protein n=1 Tax=Cyprideis torosa TaxID=163714 RepID=A0A7R8WKY2_9CRUS|nr:unnamed protein product [Cyprideis torosa]CAG0903729.1 unnamed protein product [Cyprideis torosa]
MNSEIEKQLSGIEIPRADDGNMNSEIGKEPSGIEIPRADVEYALPKFDANEILTDQNEFPESWETPLLTDFVPGSTDNNNQTSGARAPDQIEVSENEGKVFVLDTLCGTTTGSRFAHYSTENFCIILCTVSGGLRLAFNGVHFTLPEVANN